ncbi:MULTISPECIES: arginine--tRNA ligase [Clostridia]|uniref:arginine--tRNA ligase n=1 Tax=Clostridia TaxID=186801 RepID=UPI000EA322DF|nr:MULTISPECIES: arginine--tRNA ligase [Clostridia]NBJ71052.1 arginine--tRNA ligase [Roseburia sp. 1XD42-34]RKI75334.1 arginine--tRNA ligase [Clostridium sp. 1xD42-85]
MNMIQETEATVKKAVRESILRAELVEEESNIPPIMLEKPNNDQHGDYATNIAMKLTKVAKQPPREIAQVIIDQLNLKGTHISKLEIAGPGFINIFMDNNYLTPLLPHVLQAGEDYGKHSEKNMRIQVEFVSANPTGDLHLGHARGASYGDALCNVLKAAGYEVEREYYINDAGNQIHNLALSVEARYMQSLGLNAEVPEDGYHGQDIIHIGEKLAAEEGDTWVHKSKDERLAYFRQYGLEYELKKIEEDLKRFRVAFDHWFSELSLYKEGKVDQALDKMRQTGNVYQKDGATWFRTTKYGDDKDRVVIKSDGSYTYLASDIAYHNDKLERGFDKLINVWGADHHGYVPRMEAAIQALGYSKNKLETAIIQMVNLFEDGERVKMSKRRGKALTLRQLMEEVGVDAMRYMMNTRSCDSHLDFDINLARSQSNENPVYYVQYAHARICTLLKKAQAEGYSYEDYDAFLLQHSSEVELLKIIGEFPQLVLDAAEKRIPHKITQYAFDLASALHSFYNAEKVLDETQLALTKARLALLEAVKITISNALRLIGVHAPEQM